MAAAKSKPKGKSAPAAPAAPASEDLRPRLSKHPRAQKQIREAKAWGGIVGFALVGLLSLQADQTLFDAGVRALVAGTVCYVAAWAMAVVVWAQLARAEVKVAEQRFEAERQATA